MILVGLVAPGANQAGARGGLSQQALVPGQAWRWLSAGVSTTMLFALCFYSGPRQGAACPAAPVFGASLDSPTGSLFSPELLLHPPLSSLGLEF